MFSLRTGPRVRIFLSRGRKYAPTIATQSIRLSSSLPPTNHGPRVAIIGSGPAGFYTSRKLLRDLPASHIDMYERLPVPFGLVRFGVAPDHPEVKNCQDEFEEVANSPSFTFLGNITLGQDVPLPLLAKNYDIIVFAYGASKDRTLGLENEDSLEQAGQHIYSARAFVGWYNGLPEYRDLSPNLSTSETAVVVGQGNVAMDVARILLSPPSALARTDLTSYALDTLKSSTIKHVHVVGRRGPLQAAFTIKEVRELLKLPDVNFTPIDPSLFPPDLKALDRPKRRIMELLQKGRPHDPAATKSWSLDFLLSPSKLELSPSTKDTLSGITFAHTALSDPLSPSSRVEITNETTTIPTSTLFRSIGYKAEPIRGMDEIGAPFDLKTGTVANDGAGRITPLQTTTTKISAGAALYCAGWVKRGPTGVIASTMTDAFQTAEAIIADWKAKADAEQTTLPSEKRGWEAVQHQAQAEGYDTSRVVHWDGWKKIDAQEKNAGESMGKPREKMVRLDEMLGAVKS